MVIISVRITTGQRVGLAEVNRAEGIKCTCKHRKLYNSSSKTLITGKNRHKPFRPDRKIDSRFVTCGNKLSTPFYESLFSGNTTATLSTFFYPFHRCSDLFVAKAK
jgi:hypothetical protein